jgi:hypothetical protein
MSLPSQSKQYWETLDKCAGLSLAIHRAKAQIIEKNRGEPVKLEDGERSDARMAGSCYQALVLVCGVEVCHRAE